MMTILGWVCIIGFYGHSIGCLDGLGVMDLGNGNGLGLCARDTGLDFKTKTCSSWCLLRPSRPCASLSDRFSNYL
jgi:hypothetical protein